MKKIKIMSLLTMVLPLFCMSCSPMPLTDLGVKILQPRGGVVLKAGDSYEILWKTEPVEAEFGTMVTIEFSGDGGKSWEKVEENVPNNGKYAWKVPKLDSTQCKVRVFSQRRSLYRGTSEIFSVK